MQTTSNTEKPKAKGKRLRSPSYPAISLEDAIERAKLFWDHEKRHPAPIDAAAKDWNYDVKSSAVPLAIAALRKYGLLEDVGASGKQRQVKLTDSALKIILDEESNPERQSEIKAAALRPSLYRELWTKYGEQLPSDQTLKSWLLLDKKFNPASVASFIKIYKDTISFAKLRASDIIPDTTTETNHEEQEEQVLPPKRMPPPATNPSRGQPQLPRMSQGVTYFTAPLEAGDAYIPLGMSKSDWELFISTLKIWKSRIVAEGETSDQADKTLNELLE
jgi:hypothetical protein